MGAKHFTIHKSAAGHLRCMASNDGLRKCGTKHVRSTALMNFEPIIRLPTAWSSVAGQLGVHLFEGPLTVRDMDHLYAVGERWNAKHPGKRIELTVVFPSDARMSHDERVRMAHLIKLGEARRAASATVILAAGLLAAMQRSVLTGMLMLAPPPHPAKIFGALAEATKWLCPQLQTQFAQAVTVDALDSALASLVSDFLSRPGRLVQPAV